MVSKLISLGKKSILFQNNFGAKRRSDLMSEGRECKLQLFFMFFAPHTEL